MFDFFDIDVELEEYDMVKGLFLDSKIPRNLTKLFFSFKKFSSNLYSVIRQTNYSEVEYDLEYRYDYFYLKILLMRFYTLIKRQQKFYFTRFPGENIIKLISDKQINVDCYFESFPRMRFQHENSRSFRLAFTLNKTASFVPSFFLMPTSFSVNNIFLNLVPDQNKMIEFLDFVKNIFQTNLINVLRQEQFFDKAIENIFLKIDLNKILTTFIKKKKKYLKLKSNFSLKRYKKQKPLIKSLIRKRRLKAKERFRFYRNLPRVIKR